MTEKQIAFDLAMKDFGGIYVESNKFQDNVIDLLGLSNEIQILIKQAYPQFKEVNVAFIMAPYLNAVVRKIEDNYFLGINFGAVLLLKNLFENMLCHNKVLEAIGDASFQSEDLIINAIVEEGQVAYNMGCQVSPNMPKDELRRDFASQLFTKTIEFLILHEFGHIVIWPS